jgi:hypothetical protein
MEIHLIDEHGVPFTITVEPPAPVMILSEEALAELRSPKDDVGAEEPIGE